MSTSLSISPADAATATSLARILAELLAVDEVHAHSHFFDDLGADSMLMARFCARVRKRADLPTLDMRDIYQHPSIDQLLTATVAAGAATSDAPPVPNGVAPVRPRVGGGAYVLCGILQFIVFVIYSSLHLLIMVKSFEWVMRGGSILGFYQRSLIVGAVTFLALCLLPVVVKWLLIGRWKSYEFAVWSLAYLRFWIVKSAIRFSPMALLFVGTPLYSAYLRLLGAKVGRGAIIYARMPACPDLITIGSGTVIRKDVLLSGYRARDGVIETGPVSIGCDAFIGEATVIDIHTAMGDRAQIGHASSLHSGQTIPPGESWHGTPARPAQVAYRWGPRVEYRLRRAPLYAASQLLIMTFVVLPILYGFLEAIISLPQIAALLHLGSLHVSSWVFYADAAVLSLVAMGGGLLLALLLVTTVPRILNRALPPGRTWPLYGARYALHRTVERVTNLKPLTLLFGDSVFIVHYLSAIGYRLRPVEQTGTNFGQLVRHENPFLCSVGTGTVVADGLSLVNADYSEHSFRLLPARVGARSFLGNNIVYPANSRAGDDVLLGTKVMVPVDGPLREGVGLLGSPSFEIPRTVRRDAALLLHDPTLLSQQVRAKTAHNVVTMAHYLGVRWLFAFGLFVIMGLVADLYTMLGVGALLLFSPLGLCFTLAFWTVVQRCYNPMTVIAPNGLSIYDPDFWRHERFWKVPSPTYLRALSGTPVRGLLWRAAGVRVGKRLFDDGAALVEKTPVTIGDDTTLNAGVVIQCHSQEDGAFKSDRIVVGHGVTLGVGSFLHYGTTVGDDTEITADAFLMKGEEVPPGARWEGNPAREADDLPATPSIGRASPTTGERVTDETAFTNGARIPTTITAGAGR